MSRISATTEAVAERVGVSAIVAVDTIAAQYPCCISQITPSPVKTFWNQLARATKRQVIVAFTVSSE